MNFKKNIFDDGNSNSPLGVGGFFNSPFRGWGGMFLFFILSFSSFAQTPQTITFPAIAVRGYGDATFTLNASASSGLNVRYVSSDATVATVNGSTVTIKKTGAFAVISAYQDGNTTYAPATPVPQLLVVCPKNTLTVAATDKTIDLGNPTPAFNYSITGFKNNETSSVVNGSPTFQSLASLLSIGTYPIVINKGTLAATNYEFQLLDGTLTVNSTTSIPSEDNNVSFVKIYPNPVSDVLHIDFQDQFNVSIFDMFGNEIIRSVNAIKKLSLSVSQLKVGFYFVIIDSGSHSKVYKIVIAR